MSDINIKVKIEELNSKANELEKNYETMIRIAQSNVQIIDNLIAEGFQGGGAQAYRQKFESWQEAINKKSNSVNEIASALKKVSSNFENAQSENASAISQLPI